MKNLVTGANGHLGNNVVRYLLAQGEEVIAGVRNTQQTAPFVGLSCTLKRTDLLDVQSLDAALEGVDVLYQVAAVFKRWAKNPQKDIIEPNIKGTENILRAAARAGVKKVVYVSSMTTLDDTKLPLDGSTWNPIGPESPYPYSKTESEKVAHRLGKELGLDISFILPSAIVGPHFQAITPSLKGLFADPFYKKTPFNPNFYFLTVDARDVAKACLLAARKGKNGERYVISLEQPLGFAQIFEHLQKQFPDRKYKLPPQVSKTALQLVAWLSETGANLTGKEPLLTVADAKEFYGLFPTANIAKARQDLGFDPMPLETSLTDTFRYLSQMPN
ncbi:MAG: NAD-dependent epimerase/dehydratase family protein [Cytophagales bacterium]|jgi:dihydroflavonol-4-reductase|nr:NAD-dependent epimerase/dehydratase family protein [Cytophagales bacterium]